MKTAYRILWIDSQGKITARDDRNRDKIFNTIDYPDANLGNVIEIEVTDEAD